MSETLTPPPAPPAAAWHAGFDADTVGYLQNRGLADKTAAEAFLATAKAHREAERFVGAPAAELVRLPKDATDENGWRTVWSRLGKPADAKEYDLSGAKFADGSEPDEAFQDWFRNSAFAANLPKDAAGRVATEFVKYLEGNAAAEAAEQTAALAESRAALAKNWGGNYNQNLLIAQNAARALGFDQETVTNFENAVGYEKIMEMFRTIGSKIGEDSLVKGGAGPGGVMTVEQAEARITELKADKDFVKRYMAGGAPEKREMESLHRIKLGV